MDTHEHGPTALPTDLEAERKRLIDDASEHGVDVDEAIRLAERVARFSSPAEAYRAVDRRLATGSTIVEAEAVLMGEQPSPTDRSGKTLHDSNDNADDDAHTSDTEGVGDLRARAQRPL